LVDERMYGRKADFLSLTSLSFGLCLIAWELLWWLISPRFHHLNINLHLVVNTLVQSCALVFILSFLLLSIHVTVEKMIFLDSYTRWFFLHTYPLAYRLGRLFGLKKERLGITFITVNNILVGKLRRRFTPAEMMILLPHCLQKQKCEQRLQNQIDSCISCGECDLSEFKILTKESSVEVHVATGGTLARRIIAAKRPSFIIAVACHRDLVDGIREAYPIPVYGVLNERPEGPCINTIVDIDRVKKAIEYFKKKQ
jgi:uncharacterized protein